MQRRPVSVLYMPTVASHGAADLRFFVPYASHYIAELVNGAGYQTQYVDLNQHAWNAGFSGIAGADLAAFVSAGVESGDIARWRSLLADHNVLCYQRGVYLLGKDFFSFEMTDTSLLLLLATARMIKKADPGGTVVLGGSHCKPQFVYALMQKTAWVDVAFYNEIWSKPNYEDVICMLGALDGAIVPRNGLARMDCCVRGGDGLAQDMNAGGLRIYEGRYTNPFPEYEYLAPSHYDLEDVCGPSVAAQLGVSAAAAASVEGIATLKFTHGCVNQCAYCKGSKIAPQIESMPKVLDYLERMVKGKGLRHWFFLNRELNMVPGYCRELCRGLIRRRLEIKWSDSFEFCKLTCDDVALLNDAGCIQACVGIDTTSHALGASMGRDVDVEHMREMLACMRRYGIWTRANTIVGFPGQTTEDIKKDVEFIDSVGAYIDHLNISEFKLFPHTLCGDAPERYGMRALTDQAAMGQLMQSDNPNMTYYSLPFEEVGGRRWEEMKSFARIAFELVQSKRDTARDALAGRLPLVFLLYEAFAGRKEEVSLFIGELASIAKDSPAGAT
jgi:hypothetical protein